MSPHRLFERPRRASELPLRGADIERQARERGDCAGCFLPLFLHFTGPQCSGRKLSCDEALRLARAYEVAGVTVGTR